MVENMLVMHAHTYVYIQAGTLFNKSSTTEMQRYNPTQVIVTLYLRSTALYLEYTCVYAKLSSLL